MKLRAASIIAVVTICSGMLTGAGVAAGTPAAVAARAASGGTWGDAKAVAKGLNRGDEAQLNSVSCASAGNCSAGGSYTDNAEEGQAFVVTETNGIWGRAEEVPG